MKNWLIERFNERSTYDGLVFMGICAAIILFGDFAQLLAWAGLGIGITSVLRKD